MTETSFQLKEWYLESLQQRFCTQNKKRMEKIIFTYGNKIFIQTRLNLKGWTWRWFLRKLLASLNWLVKERLLSKNMKYLKIVLFPPLFQNGEGIGEWRKGTHFSFSLTLFSPLPLPFFAPSTPSLLPTEKLFCLIGPFERGNKTRLR